MPVRIFKNMVCGSAHLSHPWRTQIVKTGASKAILCIGIQMIWLTGCAKVGEPQPPEVRIPKPAVDLAAYQISDHVVLRVSMPVQNTDGSDVSTLRSIEVLRLAEDTDDIESSPALSQEEFIERSSRIISIPDSQIPVYLQDKALVIQDTLPFQDSTNIYSNTFRYGVLFVNNKNQAAGLSNQVLIKPIPIPTPPTGLSSEVTERSINLKWLEPRKNMDGSEPARIEGYNIFRSEESGNFPATPINPDPLRTAEYTDHNFLFDKTYRYAVSVIGSLRNPYAESRLSAPHMIVPQDIFPPDPPQNFSAIFENGVVILLWVAPESQDVAGYRIFRLEADITTRETLQNELIHTLSFRDNGVLPGRKYEYAIIAVDGHGNESKSVHAKVEVR